jgi:putative ABC transport system permease protein
MLIIAVVAVATGAFGPIYLHSTDQAELNGALGNAPPGNVGLTLQPGAGDRDVRLIHAADRVPRTGGGRTWFGRYISTNETGVTTVADGEKYFADLMARSRMCAHLVMVAGRCTTQTGTVVMSARSAHALSVAVGQRIDLSVIGSSKRASLTVAGLYAPNPSSRYWWGSNYFAFGTGAPGKPNLDEAFASFRTVNAIAPDPLVHKMIQVPFQPGSLAVDETDHLESLLNQYKAAASADDGVVVATQLSQVLAAAANDEHTSTSIVLVIDFEMLLLTVFALYFVASRTAAERLPDVQLAVLRGYRPGSTLVVALLEPVVIVLAAVPAGLLIAWLVAAAAAGPLFGPGVSASLTLLAFGGALLGGVIGVGAVTLGSKRLLGAAEAAVRAESPSHRPSAWRIAGDVAVIALAGAAFFELALVGASGQAGSRSDSLSAFAPGLLALAAGVVAARLLPVLVRTVGRITNYPRSVAWVLATRRVVRRPEFAPQILLVTLCSGLAVFGISGWSINARNHTVRDAFAVGASKALTVSVHPGVNFLRAVRSADQFGHSAMAVVVENASDGTTLAVDSRAMGQVMSWPPGLGAGGSPRIAQQLIPTGLAPPVQVSGGALRVSLNATVAAQPAPQLSLDLFNQGFQAPEQVTLGDLVAGHTSYEASIAGLCPETCTLTDLAVTWAPSSTAVTATGSAQVEIASISDLHGHRWETVSAGLRRARRWRSPTGGAEIAASSGGLSARFTLNPDAAPVTIAPADTPAALPTVLTTTAAALDSPSGQPSLIVGLDGASVKAHRIAEVPVLPRVGDDAALVDLAMAQRVLSGPFVDDTPEVWLSTNAPADISSRLASDGVSVVGTDSVTEREAASVHSSVNLAYNLFLIAGLTAAALAIGTTAFALAAGARRRGAELAAMLAIGIPGVSLRRSSEAEQALAIGIGLLFGAGAGLGAAAVALRSIPEFVALGPGPPLEIGFPTALLAALLLSMAALLWAVVRLGSSMLVREATIEKTGSAQS